MRVKKTTIIFFLPLTIIALTGCRLVDEPIAIGLASPARQQPAPEANVSDETIEKRFTDSQNDSTDAVQSALIWSQKYEELSQKNEKLREEKNSLAVENTELKHKLSQLGAELNRAKQELADANGFLQQMQIELTKWKGDVLGFRDEMRNAQAAQLEALKRILRVLGAETVQSNETESESLQTTE